MVQVVHLLPHRMWSTIIIISERDETSQAAKNFIGELFSDSSHEKLSCFEKTHVEALTPQAVWPGCDRILERDFP